MTELAPDTAIIFQFEHGVIEVLGRDGHIEIRQVHSAHATEMVIQSRFRNEIWIRLEQRQ